MARFIFAALAAVLFVTAAEAQVPVQTTRSVNRASARISGTREVYGATLATLDPAVSTSLDTGYLDTAGCSQGCIYAAVENTGSAVSGTCTVYGGAGYDTSVTTDDWASTIGTTTVTNGTTSFALSVCRGVGTGFGYSAPAPKHYRLYCAENTNANLRATVSCH